MTSLSDWVYLVLKRQNGRFLPRPQRRKGTQKGLPPPSDPMLQDTPLVLVEEMMMWYHSKVTLAPWRISPCGTVTGASISTQAGLEGLSLSPDNYSDSS